jgi:hypothetical protein
MAPASALMKRAARQRLVLLLAVVALLTWAGWQLQRDARDAPGTLLTLDPDSISHVALSFGGASTTHYEKRDGHWWQIDGKPARVDDARLADLTGIAAASVLRWRAASDFQPSKIGMAPPLAILVLDGQTLEFGETSVTGPQRYVRVGQRVALVSVRYMPRPPGTKVTELH